MPNNLHRISGCRSGLLAFPSSRWKSWGIEGNVNYQPWISAGAQNQTQDPCFYRQLCSVSARGGNTALKEAFKAFAPCAFPSAVTGNIPDIQPKCRWCPTTCLCTAITWLAHFQACVCRGTGDHWGRKDQGHGKVWTILTKRIHSGATDQFLPEALPPL